MDDVRAVYASTSISVVYDARGVHRFIRGVEALGSRRFRQAQSRALNHVGNKAQTQVKRSLVRQTGIKHGDVHKAVTRKMAFAGVGAAGRGASLEYKLVGSGREIPLRYFKARETRQGVSAAPWNKRRIFAHTFMRGGLFPRRVEAKGLGGDVVARAQGAGRKPIRTFFGPSIGKEIVKDLSRSAFEREAAGLPARIAHEVRFLLP